MKLPPLMTLFCPSNQLKVLWLFCSCLEAGQMSIGKKKCRKNCKMNHFVEHLSDSHRQPVKIQKNTSISENSCKKIHQSPEHVIFISFFFNFPVKHLIKLSYYKYNFWNRVFLNLIQYFFDLSTLDLSKIPLFPKW